MRRLVILLMLFILPLEVLVGISYEQGLIREAQQEFVWADSAQTGHDLSDAASDMAETQQASLDLGESYDVPCRLPRMADQRGGAARLVVAITRASGIWPVSKPPLIAALNPTA